MRAGEAIRAPDGTITSVGIDIGTTTTQLVFSRLTMGNTAGPTQVPRYVITDRVIIYGSPVAFTPKKRVPGGGDAIDEAALGDMVTAWYADAGMARENVTSGAVIITGESLKKSNARKAVFGLSSSLGDFVVATAGPHLESVIAGRGSGAAAFSTKNRACALNIDVGGGTSNYAVFSNGQVVDTACLNVGGRLVETDASGRVTAVHPPALPVLRALYGEIPAALQHGHLTRLAERMASIIYEQTQGMTCTEADALLQTEPLRADHTYDAVFISGGVGACCQTPPEDPFVFGDMGPLLAEALMRDPGMRALPLRVPEGTVRATVIGAGAWSLTLSGSTVWVDDATLPLRNIPVVSVPLSWPDVPENPGDHIRRRVALFDVDPAATPFALSFPDIPARYQALRYLAEGVAAYAAALPPMRHPLIVALGRDMGKALGMELKLLLGGRELVVVDEVVLEDGDYLDLGKAMHGGGVVPLVVKSLAFSGNKG